MKPYVFGRPPEYDREQIANDLVEWAKQDDSINLNKFCALNGIPPSYISIWAKECPHFSKAYEFAKSFIGFRREEKLNNESLHVKAYDLNAKTYDYFMREQIELESKQDTDKRKELAEHDHKLKFDSQQAVSEEVLQRFESFAGLVSRAQSERRIAATSTSAEDKS